MLELVLELLEIWSLIPRRWFRRRSGSPIPPTEHLSR
jgi:hypothetical protein